MNVTVIGATPRDPRESNSSRIAASFAKGVMRAGSQADVLMLANRSQWSAAKTAFFRNSVVVFVLPVYNAAIPGLMMEFLEELETEIRADKHRIGTKRLAFIVHSAFPEACQRRSCEDILKVLTKALNGEFAGILSCGDTFGMNFMERLKTKRMLEFEEMGVKFVAHEGSFLFAEAAEFTGSEYMEEEDAQKYARMINRFCRHVSEAKGCTESLSSQPYA